MSTAQVPLTPENVAGILATDDNGFHDGNGWYARISATGAVVSIEVEPLDEDGDPVDKVHFQAHVFQVEQPPPVAAEGVEIDVEIARELTCRSVGKTYEGWTVVEREDIDTTRWESHHRLVIRNSQGEHYGANYSEALTEYQSTRPWEGEETARFEPVTRRTKVVQAHEWIAPAAQSNTGEAETRG